MLQTETIEINGTAFRHTYSDDGMKIERDGTQYDDAIDPVDAGERVYVETEQPIEEGEES